MREKKKHKNLSLTQLFFSKADSNSSFEASFRSFEPKSWIFLIEVETKPKQRFAWSCFPKFSAKASSQEMTENQNLGESLSRTFASWGRHLVFKLNLAELEVQISSINIMHLIMFEAMKCIVSTPWSINRFISED